VEVEEEAGGLTLEAEWARGRRLSTATAADVEEEAWEGMNAVQRRFVVVMVLEGGMGDDDDDGGRGGRR